MRTPRLYLGTMTFGWSQTSSYVDESIATQMIQRFIDSTSSSSTAEGLPFILDSARIYAGGKTEEIIGSILSRNENKDLKQKIVLTSKAHPSCPGGLATIGLATQLQASLSAMQTDHLEEYYLHQPDPEHNLLESLQFLHTQVQQGKIRKIGLSNYHVTEVKRAFELCDQYQLTRPTVYQGLYNPLNRAVESELIPLLHENNCAFVAYNPLAAGLLTGKHNTMDTAQVKKGRFFNNPNYLPRFYTPTHLKAVELIRTACQEEAKNGNAGISMVQAVYTWLQYHSALRPGTDGILLGASSLEQLDENLKACCVGGSVDDDGTRSPGIAINSLSLLPERILAAFDEAWECIQAANHDASTIFPYWRAYSADMPARESLDPGASYEAAKK